MGKRTGGMGLLCGLSLLVLSGCGDSESKTAPPPSFSPTQTSAAIEAMEATTLSPLGIAAGSKTYGLTMRWRSDGTPLVGSMNTDPNLDGAMFIETEFPDDTTYFENIPTIACDRAVALSSATGGGRSKRADKVQSQIVADLRARCKSNPLTGEDIAAVLQQHGFGVQMMAAGSSSVSAPQVLIQIAKSEKEASDHASGFAEHPLPGNSVGAVGTLEVQSRGPRGGADFVDAKTEFDAAMSALQARL